MVVLRSTMTLCLICWQAEVDDDSEGWTHVVDWVSSDEEPEASYDGDPHEREADQDPPKQPQHQPDPDPEPSPDKRRRRDN